jgi:ElaB/YqjD/DUF883 family membrane-anchored ribosome-binding protein
MLTPSQLGGATLTYSILYLSLYIHRANRNVQRSLLRQQNNILNSAIDPEPPLPDPPAYEIRKAGLAEELKDRWNSEVEKLVRNFQTTDWHAKRELYEARIATAWQRVRSTEQAQELEAKAREVGSQVEAKAKETGQNLKQASEQALNDARGKVKDVGQSVREASEQALKDAKEAERVVEKQVKDAVRGREQAVEEKLGEIKVVTHEPRLLELR